MAGHKGVRERIKGARGMLDFNGGQRDGVVAPVELNADSIRPDALVQTRELRRSDVS